MALTVFTFFLGGMAYAEQKSIFIKVSGYALPATSVIAIFGVFVISAFFYMDRLWYHKLLLGSVLQGLDIEKRWSEKLPELGLTTKIGEQSPHRINPFSSGDKKWVVRSSQKFWIFYGILIVPLIVVSIIPILF